MLVQLKPDHGASKARARELELDILEREIATLSAHIDAAIWRLLELVAEFDDKKGWADAGAQSCAHWLNWRIGLSMVAAREKVRVAHALRELPLVSKALRRGTVSYSKVRAITRIATPAIERDLLEMARSTSAHHIERVVRLYRSANRREENEVAAARHDGRFLNTWYDVDGSFVIHGRLSPEVGATIMKALDAAWARLREDETSAATAHDSGISSTTPGHCPGSIAPACEPRPWRARRADALGMVAEAALASGLASRPGAEQAMVVVHIDRDVLHDPALDGRSEVQDATSVSPDTVRRIACDSSVVELIHGPAAPGDHATDSTDSTDSTDTGRRTRTIPARLRRALRDRDPGCRFPGCTRTLFLEAHHVKHWADGGETRLDNLVQLCWYHHRAMHEGGYSLDPETGAFRDPLGRSFPYAPSPVPLGHAPVDDLRARNDADALAIHPRDTLPWCPEPHPDCRYAAQTLFDIQRLPPRDRPMTI